MGWSVTIHEQRPPTIIPACGIVAETGSGLRNVFRRKLSSPDRICRRHYRALQAATDSTLGSLAIGDLSQG
jgi:hypothetical protein